MSVIHALPVIPAEAGIQGFRQSVEDGRTGFPPSRE